MSQRVLSTPEAHHAIHTMQQILNNDLFNALTNLNKQGQTLSERNVWDGALASQFSSDVWPRTHQALDNALTQLRELQGKLARINQNIMSAGGN
jgi:uncharacterized protein YukE